MIKLTLTGIPPAKKNSKRWIVRGSRRFLVPSEKHEAWHSLATYEVIHQIGGIREILPLSVSKIEITYFATDKRRRDSSNATESVMDLLVDIGVLKDDNMIEVPDLRMIYGGILKTQARTDIVIETYEPKS